MGMLLVEKADVIGFYNMQIPLLELKSAKLGGINAMVWGDWGVKLLSNGILMREDTFQANKGLARKVAHASLKGYQFAIANPCATAKSVTKRFPLLDPGVTVKEVNIVSGIVGRRRPRSTAWDTSCRRRWRPPSGKSARRSRPRPWSSRPTSSATSSSRSRTEPFLSGGGPVGAFPRRAAAVFLCAPISRPRREVAEVAEPRAHDG